MRVTIDFDRCESHGLCALSAPEVFWIDDDGYTQFVAEPAEVERANVIQAIQGCPAQAIQIVEDDTA